MGEKDESKVKLEQAARTQALTDEQLQKEKAKNRLLRHQQQRTAELKLDSEQGVAKVIQQLHALRGHLNSRNTTAEALARGEAILEHNRKHVTLNHTGRHPDDRLE